LLGQAGIGGTAWPYIAHCTFFLGGTTFGGVCLGKPPQKLALGGPLHAEAPPKRAFWGGTAPPKRVPSS